MSKAITSGKVSISGNFRDPRMVEWAGTGQVDKYSTVICDADCGEDVYDAIQSALEDGETDGTVEGNDGVTYTWSWSE